MRRFSSSIETIIQTDHIQTFVAVKFELPTITLRYTTNHHDITILGENYLSHNGLKAVEPPRLSNIADREAYKIVLVDPGQVLREYLESGLALSTVTVYVGFYNTTNTTLNGVPPGEPLLSMDNALEGDLIIAYKGFMDAQGVSISTVEGTIDITLECVSPITSLDLVRSFRTTNESMRTRNSTDSSFSDIYAGAKAVQLLWGKA